MGGEAGLGLGLTERPVREERPGLRALPCASALLHEGLWSADA